MKKLLSIFILVCFLVTSVMGSNPVYAQNYVLPAPGVMVDLSPAFNPPILKGIKIHPDDPFRFDFILDQGDNLNGPGPLSSEATKLIKYFLVSLTIPEKDLWVNLSPYEKDRIIPQSFGLTEMGRDLLAEDYMLKQITASLIYPEGMTGRKFWKRIYEDAARKFGTTNIPVNTFNKVWIVPEKALVYENAKAGTAYVVESKLKVMLEQDYLSMSKHVDGGDVRVQDHGVNALGSKIIREIVIPELTKEINEDKNFSQLRQVYNSLILATWYKKKIRDGILAQVYSDKKKIAGVGYKNSINIETIYQRYLQAFKKGVYNYIKEEQDPVTLEITPRKYFSGGARFNMDIAYRETSDPAMLSRFVSDQAMIVSAGISPIAHSNGKVLVTGFTSESARAVKVAEIINKINQLIAKEEKFLPVLNGDEINLVIKIKHLVKSLPQDEQEKAKWLDDVHFMMGERYIFSGKAIRSILWYVPGEGKYVSILLAPNLDVTKGLITELFSILHGDEFDADFTAIDSIEHTKTFDDARWDTWSYESTGAKRAYKENIHPAVFKAVLSLIEHRINESPSGAPVKIKMADIYGGDGSFLDMFRKSLRAYCETVNLRMPEMEYWLVERNANNIEAAKTILSPMTVHIIKADLTKEALQDLLPPMDIITSIGGGFNSPVASRQDAKKLSEAVSKTLAKGGRVIVTGYSVSALKVSEFEGLKPINLSIPVNFINGTYPYQMYVFERSNKDEAMASPAQGKFTVDQVIDELRNEKPLQASIRKKIDPRDQRVLINFTRLVQFINFVVPYYQILSIDSDVLENFIKAMDSKENPLIDNRPSDGTYDSLYAYNLLLLAVKNKNREVWNSWVEQANEGMDQQEIDSNEENRRYAVTPENLRLPETISLDDSYDLKLNKRFGRSAYITCQIIEKISSKVAGIINLGFDKNTSSWLAVEPHGIQIKNAYRGQGLGRKAYLKLANKLGVIRSAGITSDLTSPDAQNMWQKMGATIEYIGYYPMPYILSNESGWSWVIRSSQLAEGQSGEKGTLALIRSQTIRPMDSVKIRLINRMRMGSFLNPRRAEPQEEQGVAYSRGLPYIGIDQFTAKQNPRVDGVPYIYINEKEKTAIVYAHGKSIVDGTWCLFPKVNGTAERVIPVSYYLKALSEEGIKEVLILACNPYSGGFTVPSNMQVTYSTSFVIKSYKMMHGQWKSIKADDQEKVVTGLPETNHLINDMTRFIKKSIVKTKQSNGQNQALSIDPDYRVNHFWGSEMEKGGIDLTAAKMNLQTEVVDSRLRGNDKGIQFHLDPAMLQQLQNAQGFVPVIINIQPMTSLKMFLGAVNNQPASP